MKKVISESLSIIRRYEDGENIPESFIATEAVALYELKLALLEFQEFEKLIVFKSLEEFHNVPINAHEEEIDFKWSA